MQRILFFQAQCYLLELAMPTDGGAHSRRCRGADANPPEAVDLLTARRQQHQQLKLRVVELVMSSTKTAMELIGEFERGAAELADANRANCAAYFGTVRDGLALKAENG
jgi:hypothetical protein